MNTRARERTIVAMVPARLGSTRVPKKSIRLLGGRPLVQWVVETARDCGYFTDVYINSEAPELEHLANDLGVKFYRRPAALASNDATSEDFVADFMRATAYDVYAQILPTSPFLTADDIARALDLSYEFETVIPVRRIQAECTYAGRPLNFQTSRRMQPSQALTPVLALCNGIFVWHRATFLNSQKHYGAATFGPGGPAAYMRLYGDSALDIDTEDDWAQAEAVVARRAQPPIYPTYWSPTYAAECDHDKVMEDDGASGLTYAGSPVRSLSVITETIQDSAALCVIKTPSSRATVISQLPGEGNRRHYHPDLDEWWVVLEGKFEFVIGDDIHRLSAGDIVVCPRGVWHQITVVGDKRAIRLAVSREGSAHVYHD